MSAKKAGVVLAVGSVLCMLGRLLYFLVMLFGQRISAGYWKSRIGIDDGCDDGYYDDYDARYDVASILRGFALPAWWF